MINFKIPKNLDGAVLIQELNNAGVEVPINPAYGVACPTIWEGELWLNIKENDKTTAQTVIDAHNG